MSETTTAPTALLKVQEAAEQLKVSKSQIYMLIRFEQLGHVRLRSHTGAPGAIRIPQSAIDAYVESGQPSP